MDLRVNKMQDNFKNIAIISILLVVISINNYGTVLEYLLRTLNPTNQNAKKKLYAVVRIEELYDCPTSRLRGIMPARAGTQDPMRLVKPSQRVGGSPL